MVLMHKPLHLLGTLQLNNIIPLYPNDGLGEKDTIWFEGNDLGLSEASKNLEVAHGLQRRRATIHY